LEVNSAFIRADLVRFLVTSAGSANGGGHDAVLAFSADGEFVGRFSDDPGSSIRVVCASIPPAR
jgi:hypothetical protein